MPTARSAPLPATGPRPWGLLLLVVLTAGIARGAETNPYEHRLGADGSTVFSVVDHLRHPHFWWPRTLLNYRVVYAPAASDPRQWGLTDQATGQAVPMQVSDLGPTVDGQATATVSFFASLPSGGGWAYRLAPGAAKDAAPARHLLRQDGDQILLDSGALRLRVPASRSLSGLAEIPGPVLGFGDAQGWLGGSRLISPQRAPERLTTTVEADGPLFARVKVAYAFAGGATWTVTLAVQADQDHAVMDEQIAGLTTADAARCEFTWDGLDLTHRRGNEPIARAKPMLYRGEDPHFTGPAGIEDQAKEFYFRIAHTAADSTICTTAMDFSDRTPGRAPRAIGLAIGDSSRWDDGRYALWASEETLAIRFRRPADGTLRWLLPLAAGSRNLLLSTWNPDTAGAAEGDTFRRWSGTFSEAAVANTGVKSAKSWIAFLNSRYGGMGLDAIKDWVLTYPEKSRLPDAAAVSTYAGKEVSSPEAFVKALWSDDSELVKVEGSWLSPVSLRIMSKWCVPGFHALRSRLTPEERERATALLLFHAYVAASEDVSPMRHVLKGHPNFMADWKYPLMAGAFLFPEHPLAGEWADQFGKLMELMGVFWVRPDVPAWEARGGRWTESIATYNWAFLQPALEACKLGQRFDGRNRWAVPGLALHGAYLAGIVTAPVKLGKESEPLDVPAGVSLTADQGFQRIHPPQGAHAGRRAIPGIVDDFAANMQRFRPLVAEHLRWIGQRPAGSAVAFEDHPPAAEKAARDAGTNPRLESAKYTGYGVILRSSVDTPEEISIYLQQVDKGPNYRWGLGNEGGCGDIYYYAGGRSYCGHFGEDAGDRRVSDTEVTSNTGVFKDSTFRGIGMNDLTQPLIDLDCAQFAELLPRQGPDAYAWPEYLSRSALLVGHDYLITYDATDQCSRLSWNTIKGQDQMPTIVTLRGEAAFRSIQTGDGGHGMTSETLHIDPYKGGGDRMTLVSHRSDLKVVPAVKPPPKNQPKKKDDGKKTPLPIAIETGGGGRDLIFQERDDFTSTGEFGDFAGRVGVLRTAADGSQALALLRGTRIGNGRMLLEVSDADIAIAATYREPGEAAGRIFAGKAGTVTLTLVGQAAIPGTFHLDGVAQQAQVAGGKLTVAVPAGHHRWQLTSGAAQPLTPEILGTVHQADGAQVAFSAVAGATGYRLEVSRDQGRTWTPSGETTGTSLALTGLTAPAKLHVRVLALNRGTASRPSREYPVEVTGKPPLAPDGLRLSLGNGHVAASWGQVLGAQGYTLYRRPVGGQEWTVVYQGSATTADDAVPGVVPAWREPGLAGAARRAPAVAVPVYEYAVSARDGVGEGPRSLTVTSDPASWANWYPATPLVFRRQSAYWLPPYVTPDQVPPAAYPR